MPTSILCCCNKIKVKLKKKDRKKIRLGEAVFCFWSSLSLSFFTDAYLKIWSCGWHHTSVSSILVKTSSGPPTQTNRMHPHCFRIPPSCLFGLVLHFPAVSMRNVSSFAFFDPVGHLLSFVFSPHLSYIDPTA